MPLKIDIKKARGIIIKAEDALDRALSSGERRDLLMDNTTWTSDYVKKVVFVVENEAGLDAEGELQ